MATTEAISDSRQDLEDGNEFEYRPLSTGAIISVVFGLLSLLTFLAGRDSLQACLMLCPIPMIGLVVGMRALGSIRAMPNQLGGRSAGIAGVLLSCIGLFGGVSYASYVHVTEVPEGYTRTSFIEMRPDEVDERHGKVIPDEIKDLEGKQIFIKGFIRPGTTVTKSGKPVRNGATRFLLVRDNNECCFGDQNKIKYFDQMLVTMMKEPMDDTRQLTRVGGVLRILPAELRGPNIPVFFLDADYLK